MPPYISGKPSIHIKDFVEQRSKNVTAFPLNLEQCYFFFSARYALASGIKALGIGPGDAILLPAYNCGVEIDPILHLSVEPVFYKIGKDCLVDLDDLVSKVRGRVKAIMVTHFLGFPQYIDEIKEICIKRNLYLIEDCAHALLSNHNGKPLGSYGDVSVFSLLKTLPVPNGGVLVINNKNIKHNHTPKRPSFFATSYYAAELMKYRTKSNGNSINENSLGFLSGGLYLSLSLVRLLLIGFRKYFNPKGLYLVKPDSYRFVEELQSWGMSDLAKRVVNGTKFEEVKSVRRRNFDYLLSHFLKTERGILPFQELPPDVCPLFFPIILESAEKRDTLYKILKSRGVVTHPWWDRFHPDVPWQEYPDAVYLKKRLFGIPIHQDLSIQHVDRVIEDFEIAYRKI